MKTLSLLLVLLIAPLAVAQDVVLDLTNAKPGEYRLTIDAAGGVKLVPLKVIAFPTTDTPTNPDRPSDLKPFEQAVSSLTKQALDSGGSKTTGAGLASVYSIVASGVDDGSIAVNKTWEAIRKASEAVLAVQGDAAKWKPFRDELGKALTTLSNDGDLSTKAQVVAALRSITKGMNDATGYTGQPAETVKLDPAKAGILGGIDLASLIALLKIIMELLKQFGA